MTDGEKRAYGRGYNAGRGSGWPIHKLPVPPEPVLTKMVAALTELRNAVDGLMATWDEDDAEMEKALGVPLDAATEALRKYEAWLVEPC